MSENLDLVRSIYSDWERGDFSHGEWADPEIEWVLVEGPSPGTWHGLAGMAEGFRAWFSASKDVHVYADEFREIDEERVVVLVHATGRGKSSGLEYSPEMTRTAHLFHVRGGKVVRFLFYLDSGRALAHLGLSDEAMSQENVEVVKRAFDAFNRRDLDAWLAGWDVQCEYQPALERDMAGEDDRFRGHQGLRRWWQQMSEAWSYWHSEVHEVRPVADRVLTSITLRAKGRASGAVMEASFFLVGTFRDGKILSSRDYADRAQALKAVGLAG